MNKYLIKVITKCGYIIYTENAESAQQAECIVKNRMREAGWGELNIKAENNATGRP